MIPHTFHEAMNLPDKELWKAASDREMDSLKRNNVYSLVPSSSVPMTQVNRVPMGLQDEGRFLIQGPSRRSGLGAGPWRRLWQHFRTGLQDPKHPHGISCSGGV